MDMFTLHEHEFTGQSSTCSDCHCTGCHQHMFNTKICQKCQQVAVNNAIIKENICEVTTHVYIGACYDCTTCGRECCYEHIHDMTKRTCQQCYNETDEALLEIKARQCQQCDTYYIGRAYQCEDCHQCLCQHCILSDAWEKRVHDNVFLCHTCYSQSNRLIDVG